MSITFLSQLSLAHISIVPPSVYVCSVAMMGLLRIPERLGPNLPVAYVKFAQCRYFPYRKSMDPGCGSATVLMPLQVLLSSCYGRKALIRSNTVYFWMLDNLNSLLVTNTMRLEITWKLLTRFHFWIRVDILDTCSKRMRIQMFWILVQKKNTYLSIKSFYSALAEVSYAEVRLNFNLQKGQNPAPPSP
jgi:hypothetical protein